MRILELVNTLEIGGAERMVADLSRELASKGHTVVVACLRRSGPLAERLRLPGIEIVEFNKKDEGFSLKVARSLGRLLKSNCIDVVHTHNPLVHHYGLIGARLAHVPVVVNTLHGPANVKPFDAATVLFELGCLLSDRVVSCCAAVATHLRQTTLIAGRKSVVIPNGIPVEIFGRAGERRRDGEFVFGTVGRLVPVKDHRSLIQAFARVAREKQCRLEVLGDGPLRNELEEAARAAGVADSVRFLGAGLDVGAFLSGIDAFVLSSLSEGLPLTVLEAMASGLPVLSTEVGAVPELVNSARCGWIVPPGDADALAAAMLEAATASDLAERGGRARDYVRGEYSTTVMASGYESLFTSLLTAH
jgi:glycosyltransferase involved in cell wall biosynthesis